MVSPAAIAARTTYLYEMRALKNSYGSGAYTISGELYEQSVRKYCGSSNPSVQAWATAGYERLTAIVGISDNEDDALGAIARVGIKDHNGVDLIDPFDVSLGSPVEVDIALNGAVQVQITCVGRDAATNEGRYGFGVVLGNGALHADT
jgi:hypothetical protein